jgi:hypothetical protein
VLQEFGERGPAEQARFLASLEAERAATAAPSSPAAGSPGMDAVRVAVAAVVAACAALCGVALWRCSMDKKQELNPKLLRAIYGVAREKGISNEEIHEAAFAGWKVKSLKDLRNNAAIQLIEGMKGKVFEDGRNDWRRRDAMSWHGRKKQAVDTEYLINEAEINMLKRVARARGWGDEQLAAFTERQLGHAIRTMADLNKVLWPLKAMNRRDGIREVAA